MVHSTFCLSLLLSCVSSSIAARHLDHRHLHQHRNAEWADWSDQAGSDQTASICSTSGTAELSATVTSVFASSPSSICSAGAHGSGCILDSTVVLHSTWPSAQDSPSADSRSGHSSSFDNYSPHGSKTDSPSGFPTDSPSSSSNSDSSSGSHNGRPSFESINDSPPGFYHGTPTSDSKNGSPTSGANSGKISYSSASPSGISVTAFWPSGVPTTAHNSLSPAQSSAIFFPNIVQAPLQPSDIPSGKGALSQQRTNGGGLLGTFNAPKYGPYLSGTTGVNVTATNGTNGGAASGEGLTTFPWGNFTANGTNPYTTTPSTGVTRSYDWKIARGTAAPDGVEREMILVNGVFPGPTIEANWGDTISVTVKNSITGPEEGTSFHWHGLLQKDTPYMDGVPGIHQCPIAPGSSLTYTFTADLYGTTWYHSHFSAQYAGGLFGAMIIHGPTNADYDIDLGPVLLTDYYHKDYMTIVEEVMGTDLTVVAPYSVNNLINGKGNFNCSLITDNSTTCTENAGLSKFGFTTGSVHRLRLINAGAEGIQKFSIDNHVMKVMAYDFVEIVPYETTIVTLAVGQRADVLVTANGTADEMYWMRTTISDCSLSTQPDGLAIIYYPGTTDSTDTPSTTAWTDDTEECENDDLSEVVPYYSITPATDPFTTITLTISDEVNSTGNFLWTVNNSTFRVDYNDPIYELANQGNDSYPNDPNWNIYDLGSNDTVRVIVYNPTAVAHPMHIHGHNMYLLASGVGTEWDGTITNAANPTRRDVHLLPPAGYMVMQIDADNPGVWPFHCHIAWHVSGGLYVNLLERPSDIQKVDIPSTITDTCTTWSTWTSDDTVDQIDSGLKRRHSNARGKRWSNMIGTKVGSREFGVRKL